MTGHALHNNVTGHALHNVTDKRERNVTGHALRSQLRVTWPPGTESAA